MKKNIGKKDRLFRLFLAVLFGLVALFVQSVVLKIVLVLVSLFSVYEALIGWCAFYALIGKNTCPIEYE